MCGNILWEGVQGGMEGELLHSLPSLQAGSLSVLFARASWRRKSASESILLSVKICCRVCLHFASLVLVRYLIP